MDESQTPLVQRERRLVWVRWAGVAFGLLQVTLEDASARPLGYAIVAALAVANLCIAWLNGRTASLARQRALGAAAMASDTAALVGLTYLYAFQPHGSAWLILYLAPLEAALRYGMRGALGAAAAVSLLYLPREVYRELVFGFPASVPSAVFRLGVLWIVAAFGGATAQQLARETQTARRHAAALALARDELERRVDERTQELGASEERFRQMAEHIQDVFWLGDLERAIYVSPTYQTIYGRPPKPLYEGLGAFFEAVHPEDRERVAGAIEAAGVGDFAQDFRIVRPDGDVRWIESRGFLIRDESGAPYRMAGVSRDVTRQKETEQALRDSNRRLEVALSELQRAQSALLQQERLSALGQMASGIAHDLNNALAPVVGFSELLLAHPKDADAEKGRRYLDLIHTGALDAAAVVRRLREFHRPRGEDEPLAAVDLNALVEQVVRLTEPKWRDQALSEGKTLAVETDLGSVAPVLGDAAELREALTNLIFNAVDATPHGTITLRTRLAELGGPIGSASAEAALGAAGSDGVTVLLEVTDTGVGMPEDVRRRCLEPFFTTKGVRGTGLGLAMVFGTVRRHNGTLEIDSQVGLGTTIRLHLPMSSPRDETASGAGTASLEAAPAIPPAAFRALVVDDEPLVRQVACALLAAAGHSVTEAASGQEALEHLRARPFDLLVTDRAMPEMNGEQLAAAVKHLSPATRVVLLTGYGDLMLAAGETPAGVDVVLGKPLTLYKLRQAVARLRPAHLPPAHAPAA